MGEVAHSRNLLSGFVTTLKRLFESVVGTLFCLLLYIDILPKVEGLKYNVSKKENDENVERFLLHNFFWILCFQSFLADLQISNAINTINYRGCLLLSVTSDRIAVLGRL